jgi:opacity protein-like surface antigen
MKSLLFFALFLWAINLTLVSQTFKGGILAGVTASQVDGDSYAGYNKAGLYGGVFVTTKLTENLGVRLEIKYTSRGARNRLNEDNSEIYVLRLNYIDIPLMATLRIRELGSFELGVIPGYLFSAGGSDEGGKLPGEYLVDFRKFDMGTLIGASIDITPKFALNARYSYSIFSIRDVESSGAYYSWFGKLFGHANGDYNNYISLGIGYLLK